MELNFVQSSEVFGKNTLAWETEFEATGDFNLHVERNKGGDILVYQRTAGSGYAIVEEFRGMDNKPAIDLDFTSVVYPKFIKIVSESQPTYATVTTDGEITEIKSQSKEVEVTSNGTTEVTPDAGFNYLNSVKVKTNVAQSGEGGGSASSWRYYSVKTDEQRGFLQDIGGVLSLFKLQGRDTAVIFTGGVFLSSGFDASLVLGFAINENQLVSLLDGSALVTCSEWFSGLGVTIDSLDTIYTRITKEQFYNLNA